MLTDRAIKYETSWYRDLHSHFLILHDSEMNLMARSSKGTDRHFFTKNQATLNWYI